ncbi:MAG: hypothetical protein ACOVQN_04155, partial [Exiguobacterium sp.]
TITRQRLGTVVIDCAGTDCTLRTESARLSITTAIIFDGVVAFFISINDAITATIRDSEALFGGIIDAAEGSGHLDGQAVESVAVENNLRGLGVGSFDDWRGFAGILNKQPLVCVCSVGQIGIELRKVLQTTAGGVHLHRRQIVRTRACRVTAGDEHWIACFTWVDDAVSARFQCCGAGNKTC